MRTLSKNVFLVQGQLSKVVDGKTKTMPGIVQQVVISANAESAMALVKKATPEFQLVGYASLEDYESTASKVRAVADGVSNEFPLLKDPKFKD